MSKHYVIFYTDDLNVKDWGDLTPDKVHTIKFKGKQYDEVRYGKWIDAECYSEGCDDGYICSECRRITYRTMTPYCPNCGAKMNEVSE